MNSVKQMVYIKQL